MVKTLFKLGVLITIIGCSLIWYGFILQKNTIGAGEFLLIIGLFLISQIIVHRAKDTPESLAKVRIEIAKGKIKPEVYINFLKKRITQYEAAISKSKRRGLIDGPELVNQLNLFKKELADTQNQFKISD